MENQHRQIKGYRELTQGEIDLMNEIKTKGQELEALISKVSNFADGQVLRAAEHHGHNESEAGERERVERADPQRWVAIARTDFQTALMALTRAVAQPTSF